MKNLEQELKKIYKDGRSFLGIDGGNINSKVWFCGIEFGGTLEEMSEYNKVTIKHYSSDKFDLPIPYRKDAGSFESSKYDLFLSEMIINIFNIQNINRSDYLKNKLYNKDSNIFKLNIYPLAKKDTDWNPDIERIFKITKNDYYSEYYNMRIIFLKSLIKKYKPKQIICTAVKNSESKFVEAFLDNNKKIEYSWNYEEFQVDLNKTKRFKISKYNQDNTSLIIIPFPGMGNGNLNSYNDVVNMAHYLRKNYL